VRQLTRQCANIELLKDADFDANDFASDLPTRKSYSAPGTPGIIIRRLHPRMVKSIVPNTPPKPHNKFVAARTATELQRNCLS